MNLNNPAAFDAVRAGVHELIGAFDWDGVNVAELYFESLEGAANPARFTPMNDDIRREFKDMAGFDPLELFAGPGAPDEKRLHAFLDYRADLARRMQQQWMEELESIRRDRPNLDLVLTHVDDRFDTRMHDLIGADAARALPLAEQHDFTFLIEDPATVWHFAHRPPGDRHQYCRALPGCLSDETTNRRRVVSARAPGVDVVSAGGAVFRKLHPAAGPGIVVGCRGCAGFD